MNTDEIQEETTIKKGRPKKDKVAPEPVSQVTNIDVSTAKDGVIKVAPTIQSYLKVAIVGTTPHRSKAPYDDPTWEIWSQSYPDLPRWTRWFEIHNIDKIRTGYKPLWDFLVASDGSKPIYLQRPHPEVKGSIPYPLQPMIDKFGPWFFTSTCAYEMALAIASGAREIGIFGIDMADNTEYVEQKPGCRYFIQLAKHMGIKVWTPEECELLNPARLYGFEEDKHIVVRQAKRQELEQRKSEIMNQASQLRDQFQQLDGAIQMLNHADHNWFV